MKIENVSKFFLFAALLVCSASSLVASSHHKGCCSTGCKSRGITQEIIDRHGGTLVLSKSGSYHLEHDVKGTIYIKSSNICLDLCCHTVNAKCRPNAIVVGEPVSDVPAATAAASQMRQMIYSKELAIQAFLQKEPTEDMSAVQPQRQLAVKKRAVKAFSLPAADTIHHIRISNGSVVGATEDAILVNSVFDVALSNLTMLRNDTNAITVNNSNAVAIEGVTCFGGGADPQGERALRMTTTDNFSVKNLAVTGYTCTAGAAVEFEECHTGCCESVDLSLNSSQPAEVVYYDTPGAFVTVFGCSEVALKGVCVNNNLYGDSGKTFSGIFFLESDNCTVLDCQVCNNTDQSTAEDASFDGLFFLFSNNSKVNGYAFNENRTINYRYGDFCGILYSNSANAVCENVQINRNTAEDISWFSMHGIWTVNFFDGPETHDITMRNCEVMENSTNGSSDGVTSYIAIRVNSSDNKLENCRMNSNKGYTEAAQFIQGFACSGGSDSVRIVNCQANFNDAPDAVDYVAFPGAAACVGFNFHAGIVEMSNTLASYNGNAGLLTYGNIEVQCDTCVFDRNGTVSAKVIGAGLAVGAPALGSSGKLVLRNSLISRNGSSKLTQEGYGIYVNPGRGNAVLVENTDIFETSGANIAAGIFSDSTNGVVLKNVNVRDTFGVPLTTDCFGIYLANSHDAVIENCTVLRTGAVSNQLYVALDPPLFPVIAATLTNASLPVTSTVTAEGALADPLNACSSLTNSLTGKIGVMKWSWPSCAGSVTRVGCCVAAGDVATIIVQSNPTTGFTGSNAQVNCSVAELEGDALIDAITNNPGLELSIGYFPAGSGVGIKFENVSVFEITGTSSNSNANEGYMLVGSSNGIVQECRALSNGGNGFFDDQADLSKINTYIENVGSKNNTNFNVGVNTMIDNISVN